ITTLAKLRWPMTRAEFFRVLAPFTGQNYNDGHTEIIPLAEEWDAYDARGGKVPPFTIRIDGLRVIVAKPIGSGIPAGAELLSLNNVKSQNLRKWLTGTKSAEAQSGREAFAAR